MCVLIDVFVLLCSFVIICLLYIFVVVVFFFVADTLYRLCLLCMPSIVVNLIIIIIIIIIIRTKTSFSHLCISVITYPIGTNFATQLSASQGSLHSKCEGNRSSHFRDTSCQSFIFFFVFFFPSSSSFRTLAKIAITSKRVLRSP